MSVPEAAGDGGRAGEEGAVDVIVVEEANPYDVNGVPRDCAACSESIFSDIVSNSPSRIMYWIEPDAMHVCENCLPGLESR